MEKYIEYIKRLLPEKIKFYLRLVLHRDIRKELFFQKSGIRYKRHLPDFPPMVMIDTTTRCNLACTHCPSSNLSKDPTWVGDMDFELYKKIIDEIAEEAPHTIVRPFDGGEPLMRKDIEKLIKYAKDKGIRHVSINTNGTLLSEKRSRSILDSGLDHLEISIDAFSKETYKSLKKVNLYKKVVQNVETLVKLKERIRPEFKVSVSFVRQIENAHEYKAFYANWKEKVNKVTIRDHHTHGGLVDNCGLQKDIREKYRPPCPYLWNRMIIQHNGNVRFCENDWKAEHTIGNTRKQTLRQIWHSKKYEKLREGHLEGSFDHPFCQKCSDWKVVT